MPENIPTVDSTKKKPGNIYALLMAGQSDLPDASPEENATLLLCKEIEDLKSGIFLRVKGRQRGIDGHLEHFLPAELIDKKSVLETVKKALEDFDRAIVTGDENVGEKVSEIERSLQELIDAGDEAGMFRAYLVTNLSTVKILHIFYDQSKKQ